MQIRPLIAAAASAALLTLAGCNNQPEVVNSGIDRTAPPPLKGRRRDHDRQQAYRCSDNSLFYVNFLSNNTAAVRRTRAPDSGHGDRPSQLAYVGEGIAVSGSGDNVTINGKSCHT